MTSATPIRVVLLAERLDREATGAYAAALSRTLREQGHEVFLILRDMPSGPAGEMPARLCRRLSAWTSGGSMREFLVGELEAFDATMVHAADPRLGLRAREIAILEAKSSREPPRAAADKFIILC